MGSSWEKRRPVRSARRRQVLRRAVTSSPPWVFSDPVYATISPSVGDYIRLASPCALSRLIAERGNTAGLPQARRCGIYPRFSSLLVWLLLGRPVFSPLKFLRVDSFSLLPHSFILMFVLLFALRRLSYVCVYFCRLTLVSYYYT
jgi:hypothetical protein